ncbi:hypothetical protein LUZ60_005545 [Juncus effusus]|nr:hypothetical protein LUZ60_005545 [Juncus effusus]
MRTTNSKFLLLLAFFIITAILIGVASAQNAVTCLNRPSKCFLKRLRCPAECPFTRPTIPKAKSCFLDCQKCEVFCRGRKPSCNGLGSGCYDPRFIGGDGGIFYFHGKRGNHYALVSDPSMQINAGFIGLRPQHRKRDFTWIQSLGLMFSTHAFTIEAKRVETWDETTDHFGFSYDGKTIHVQERHLSSWNSSDETFLIERTGRVNSVVITVVGVVEILVNVVPITEEDDRIHGYNLPSNDCFAHLDVQFRFFGLSPQVEGILGRTYQPDYDNSAKRGVEMPVVGGEDKYWTSSLLSPDCKLCLFSPRDLADI